MQFTTAARAPDVGMVDEHWVMVTAILVSIGFMLLFAKPIGDFVERHPTVKILALSFLIMVRSGAHRRRLRPAHEWYEGQAPEQT